MEYRTKFEYTDEEKPPLKIKVRTLLGNEAVYRIYADIESNDTEVIAKIEWNEFENDNTVLFPGKEEPFEFFRRVRLLFFKNCIENTQEEAIAKVLELKK